MKYPEHGTRGRGGFTLIELIGVLAIIAILAAMIVPSVIDQMYRAAGGAEEENLATIAEGIRLSAQNTNPKKIPGTVVTACGGGNFQEWVCAASAQVNIGPAQINTNPQNLQRYYVWDNGGVPAIPAGGYVQTSAGTAGPITQRIMLLASVGSPIAGVASGAMATANFNTIWNWDGQSQSAAVAAIVGIPAARLPGDFRVERIHLAPLFHPITINPADTNDAAAYSIDGGATQWAAIGANVFFIHGTNMALLDWTGAATLSTRTATKAASFTFRADTACVCDASGGSCACDCNPVVINNSCVNPASAACAGASCYWTSP